MSSPIIIYLHSLLHALDSVVVVLFLRDSHVENIFHKISEDVEFLVVISQSVLGHHLLHTSNGRLLLFLVHF